MKKPRIASTCIPILMLAVGVMTASLAGAQPPSFPFPALADDLNIGQYWYQRGAHKSPQEYAYDLGVVEGGPGAELNDDDLHSSDGSVNKQWYVYGKPAYAIADGYVTRCWRNAPQNEPYGRHEDYTNNLIKAPGNFLQVSLTSGGCVRYSHFQPGTIPQALCPHDAKLLSKPGDGSPQAVPKERRPFVRQGQRIGLVGNTGNSGNPHLHIQLSPADNIECADKLDLDTEPLAFDSIMVRDAGQGVTSAKWQRTKGQRIPPKAVAIAPNFSKGSSEIARHGIPAADFQFHFDHIGGSGYEMSWIDGFNDGKKIRINAVFNPRSGKPWIAFWGRDGAAYDEKVDDLTARGFTLIHTDSYEFNDKLYYAAILRKKTPGTHSYHGVLYDDHQDRFDMLTADGWRPRSLSVTPLDGKLYYATVYDHDTDSFEARSQLTYDEFKDKMETNKDAGRQLTYLNTYLRDGTPKISAVWRKGPGTETSTLLDLTGSEYQAAYNTNTDQGLHTKFVAALVDGGTSRYVGHWQAPPPGSTAGYWLMSSGGTGPWSEINRSSFSVNNLGICDFDGNGRADVLATTKGRWYVSYNGTTRWKRVNTSRTTTKDMRFGDFDGDGKCDVFSSFNGAWFVSHSATSKWSKINTSQTKVASLRVADFNGDGRADVFATFNGRWNVSYGGTTKWKRINTSSITVDKILLGDLNKDGRADVFSAFNGKWNVSWGGLSRWSKINSSKITSVRLADFNADGRDDVVARFNGNWHVSYSGTGRWRDLNTLNEPLNELAFGDFDGDGATDVFTTKRF